MTEPEAFQMEQQMAESITRIEKAVVIMAPQIEILSTALARLAEQLSTLIDDGETGDDP